VIHADLQTLFCGNLSGYDETTATISSPTWKQESKVMSRRKISVALGALALAAGAAHAADRVKPDRNKPARHYDLTQLAVPDNPNCEPTFAQMTFMRGMNASGQIVGYHTCWLPTGSPDVPFVPNDGDGYVSSGQSTPQALPPVLATSTGTLGRAINDAGVAVGWEFTESGIAAVQWPPSGGAFIPFVSDACGFITEAEAINNVGSVAGAAQREIEPGLCTQRWILKRANGEEVLGPNGTAIAINDQDVLAGMRGRDAVKWSPATGEVTLAVAGPLDQFRPLDINDAGEVVGHRLRFSDDSNCIIGSEALYWSADGTQSTLPPLRGLELATALGINEHSLIVGNSGKPQLECNVANIPAQRAVIWHEGRPIDLNGRLRNRDARRVQLISGSSINERGEISALGFYRDEAPKPCWNFVFDPQTGDFTYDNSLVCQSLYAFKLTPAD
jgi:hypothetical protein